MNIAFYLENLRSGGVQRRTMRLLRGLVAEAPESWSITLIVNYSEGEHFSDIPEGIEVVVLGNKRRLSLLFALKRIASRERFDICFHCMGRQFIQWRLATIGATTKNVVIQAVPVHLHHASRVKNFLRAQVMSAFYVKADRLVSVSTAVKQSIDRLGRSISRKSRLIYNPVYDENILRLSTQIIEVVQSDDWSSHINGVAVGRLNYQKNYELMLDAVALIVPKVPSFRLHIIGSGELLSSLQQKVADLNIVSNVFFHGFYDNPYPIVRAADVFLMSSRWEGLPNALIEALSLGTPVVSTDCVAGPAEILDDGKHGSLVPMDNVRLFADAVVVELALKRDPGLLCERGRYFSVKRSAQEYVKLIKEFCV